MPRTVKVAVIGSGLAGLTAAYRLCRTQDENVKFDVHLFEKSDAVGLDGVSVDVVVPGVKNPRRITVPMRSFQGGYYKQLIALYKSLGASLSVSNYSYSFSTLFVGNDLGDRRIKTRAIYNGSSGRTGFSKPKLFGPVLPSKQYGPTLEALANVYSWMLFVLSLGALFLCSLVLLFHSIPVFRSSKTSQMSFEEWTLWVRPRRWFFRLFGIDAAWDSYAETVLVPMYAGVCSASREDILQHPVEDFLDYMWLTLGTSHYVIDGGLSRIETALAEAIPNIHLKWATSGIIRDPANPLLVSVQATRDGHTHTIDGFHHVIFATQANRAVPILTEYQTQLPEGPTKDIVGRQIACLEKFRYIEAIIINHTDDTVLPDCDEDIRDLNLIALPSSTPSLKTDPSACSPSSCTMATYILPEGTDRYPLFQTTNPIIPIQPDTILSKVRLERALSTMEGKKAVRSLMVSTPPQWWESPYQTEKLPGPLQGAQAKEGQPLLWFCGAYAHEGIPLLEGCVVSAGMVAREIVEQEGGRVSW